MVRNLDQALHTIKSTMHHHKNDAYFPYFFIVGAGVSVPEIPSASQIVEICKETVQEIDPELFAQYVEESNAFSENGMKYYSSWIEYAYPNRINRSTLFKELCSKAKISSANLMLAQVLHSKGFANTVFTTNFDDSIKKALELMGTKNFFCAENTMDNLVISNQTKDIQVIHVHGTFNFYDCANLEKEIDHVAAQSGTVSSSQLLSSFLSNQAPIIVGYSGWENDVIMRCLKERLTYPTPLQYIWVCYNKQSYTNLPSWIKENDSVIFVIPESDKGDCNDTCDPSAWDGSNNTDCIDATIFFKRIISSFKLKTPQIFTDPYAYYSHKISSILPKNEDVLHLRHWTQRLKILESDDVFEKLVHKLETLYIAKDYEEANNVLIEISGLPLSAANAEFICASFIKEFIRDEDYISSLDQRLNFHFTSLAFIEKNLSRLNNTSSLLSTLRMVLFTKFRYSEKDKVFSLFDRVIDLARKDQRLLIIELTALGTKSSFLKKDLKQAILRDIIARCPDINGDADWAFLKFKALCELGSSMRTEEAVSLVEEAEVLLPLLKNDRYRTSLCLAKSRTLPCISTLTVKEKWIKDIIEVISAPNDTFDLDVYIEIAAYLSFLDRNTITTYISKTNIENVLITLLHNYSVDQSTCHSILHYSQCCELICKITKSETTLVEFCGKVFELMAVFPHVCKSYLTSLLFVAETYISLPTEVVDEPSKINIISRIKENELTKSIYPWLLEVISDSAEIKGLSVFQADITYLKEQRQKVNNGYQHYCDGNREIAEQLFTEVSECTIVDISDMAKTNLAYMVRRNETTAQHSFEELIQSISELDCFDYMNILLYCVSQKDDCSDLYQKAKSQINGLSQNEKASLIKWWSNAALVGEAESTLALSLINATL